MLITKSSWIDQESYPWTFNIVLDSWKLARCPLQIPAVRFTLINSSVAYDSYFRENLVRVTRISDIHWIHNYRTSPPLAFWTADLMSLRSAWMWLCLNRINSGAGGVTGIRTVSRKSTLQLKQQQGDPHDNRNNEDQVSFANIAMAGPVSVACTTRGEMSHWNSINK